MAQVSKWLRYLVDEAGEAVVEALDLLLLVAAAHRQAGVDLQVERRQQALVDRQRGQRGPQASVVVLVVAVGVQRAAAQGDAAEASLHRAEPAQPAGGAAAAADRAAGADSLGAAQTHDGETDSEDECHRETWNR